MLATVVFLRGVNVGGHKAFRSSVVVQDLKALEVGSIGAAGTFVVRAPASATAVRAKFLERLPLAAHVIVCAARDLVDLVRTDPFAELAGHAPDGQFISVLERRPRRLPALPHYAPVARDWQVQLLAVHGRFVVSVTRKMGRTLVYPNEVVERHLGVAATTRGWPTILKVYGALQTDGGRAPSRSKSG